MSRQPGAGTREASEPSATLTFIGTATTVLALGPFTVLTDPNFLHRGQLAYLGKGLFSKRLTEPAMQVEDLPALSAVLLSHLHGDHWDRVAAKGLDRAVPVLTTPHAARRLARAQFRTVGLPTWESYVVVQDGCRLTVEALPAVHAYGLMGRLLPPVMGSMLTLEGPAARPLRLYVTGDTLLGGHLEQISARHPDLDAAVVHLGGTRVLGRLVTLDAAGGVELLRRVRPGTAVPVHHGDYGVFRSPLSAFTSAWEQDGDDDVTRVVVVDRGSTITLSSRD